MKDFASYNIPEEQLNVVLLSKEIYELPDGGIEIKCTSRTLHPFYRRTLRWYDHFSEGLLGASRELTNLEVGRFYTITGFLDICMKEKRINETVFSPEYQLMRLNEDWAEIISLTIESVDEDELFTHVDAWGFNEEKKYSKDEAFWWAKSHQNQCKQ